MGSEARDGKVGFRGELRVVSARRSWNLQGGDVGTLRGTWSGSGIVGPSRAWLLGSAFSQGKPPWNTSGMPREEPTRPG